MRRQGVKALCVLVSTDRTVNTIVHTAVGRVALANLPHKDLLGKGKGRGRENDPSSSEEGGGQCTIARPHTRGVTCPSI